MGKETLVEGRIVDAVRLIQKLDEEGKSPTFAIWYLYEDVDEWRLVIAGPAFDLFLPKNEDVAYMKLIEAMTSLPLSSLSVSDLKLIRTDAALPQALRVLIRTPSTGTVRAQFSDTTLNGIFVKEMIILRSA